MIAFFIHLLISFSHSRAFFSASRARLTSRALSCPELNEDELLLCWMNINKMFIFRLQTTLFSSCFLANSLELQLLLELQPALLSDLLELPFKMIRELVDLYEEKRGKAPLNRSYLEPVDTQCNDHMQL